MSEHNKAGSRAHGGISVKSVELAVAVLLFALGALVVFDSQRLGARWGDDGPQSGYFPFYIGLIICISSVIVFVQGLLEKPGQRLSIFVEWGALRQVLSVLLPAAVFVLGMQLFGIYAAGAVYIAVFMVWLGKYGWIKSLLIAGGISQVLLVVFEMWFKVPLHKGSLYDLTFIFEAVPEFFRPVALAIARLIAGGLSRCWGCTEGRPAAGRGRRRGRGAPWKRSTRCFTASPSS